MADMRSARGDDFMFVSPVSASDDRMIDLQERVETREVFVTSSMLDFVIHCLSASLGGEPLFSCKIPFLHVKR